MINLKNRHVIILLSIFWGLGLSCLFKKVCKGRNCIQYRAPPLNYVKNNTFKYNDKCYSYTPKVVSCEGKKTITNEDFSAIKL